MTRHGNDYIFEPLLVCRVALCDEIFSADHDSRPQPSLLPGNTVSWWDRNTMSRTRGLLRYQHVNRRARDVVYHVEGSRAMTEHMVSTSGDSLDGSDANQALSSTLPLTWSDRRDKMLHLGLPSTSPSNISSTTIWIGEMEPWMDENLNNCQFACYRTTLLNQYQSGHLANDNSSPTSSIASPVVAASDFVSLFEADTKRELARKCYQRTDATAL
jgi:hypothetical protein